LFAGNAPAISGQALIRVDEFAGLDEFGADANNRGSSHVR
jgi:hypothetical protein